MDATEKRWTAIETKLAEIKAAVSPLLKTYKISENDIANQSSQAPQTSQMKSSTKAQSRGTMLLSITADPKRQAPSYLKAMLKSLAKTKALSATTHIHSSVKTRNAEQLKDFICINEHCDKRDVFVVFIWKSQAGPTTLRITGGEEIAGDSNIAR